MTLKEIKEQIKLISGISDMPDASVGQAIAGSIDRCISDIEARKLAGTKSRYIGLSECKIDNQLAFVKIEGMFSVEAVYMNCRDSRYKCDYSYDGDGRIAMSMNSSTLSYILIYAPELERFGSYDDSYIPDLPEGILSLIPYFVVGDITLYDESSIASLSMNRYYDAISSIEAKNNSLPTAIDSIYVQDIGRTEYTMTKYDSSGTPISEQNGISNDEANKMQSEIQKQLDSKADNMFYDENENMWYLTSGGLKIAGPFDLGVGQFGSGGNSSSHFTLKYEGKSSITAPTGSPVSFSFNWSSVKSKSETGPGTMVLNINSEDVLIKNVHQGVVEFEVSQYLKSGSNSVKVTLSDIYGSSDFLIYSVTLVQVKLESSFDGKQTYIGPSLNYTFIPTFKGMKKVYFVIDDRVETTDVSFSGEQITHPITGLSHGNHSLLVYFTCEIDGETVRSNELYYDLSISVEGNTAPIIASDFRQLIQEQYISFVIPYRVYTPGQLNSPVTLSVNGDALQTLNVDREEQSWVFIPEDTGEYTLEISSGNSYRSFNVSISPTSISSVAVSADLSLFLTAAGRSNSESARDVWADQSNQITAELNNFNFVSDGWHNDMLGNSFIRLTGNARVFIPYMLFGSDFKQSGKTIEFEFSTSEVSDYETEIISCYANGRGIVITPSLASLYSQQCNIQSRFKEEEHIRVSFVIEKQSGTHLILMYMNGVICSAQRYPVGDGADDFRQLSPVGITIGSNSATTDIYCIRVYDNDLTRRQMLNNYIADIQNGSERKRVFSHNDNYDDYGLLDISKLPDKLPYMIIDTPKLPEYKGDKKSADIEFTDPFSKSRSFRSKGTEINVQGTSSQFYFRKNFKIKFKNGFTSDDSTSNMYSIRDGSIPVDAFTFKADVASSEGANNVELVRLYNDAQPFKVPPQKADSRVRVGIDGFPIVAFHNDGNESSFYAKMNFNNDKGSEELFGFEQGDESWEILNNTSDRVLFKSDNFEGDSWLKDFEGRYPDGNSDKTKLHEMVSWVVSTNREAATGIKLSKSVTYGGVTYTHDTPEYRLAKFKNELSDHFSIDSSIYYYLFTELFLLVDSRAKNAFPTYYKSRVEGDGGNRWFWIPYDMDTAIGINNEGSLVFGYSLEDRDTFSGADVYNGQDSVFWCNLRDAFSDEIAEMYKSLRTSSIISYDETEKRFEEHQEKWSAAIFNEDSYSKCILPLILNNDATYLPMLQGSKEQQRKWWLYNRFRYIDSKYHAGDALSDYIQMRGYAKADITVTPYADIYPCVKYGSYTVSTRGFKDNSYTLQNPLSNVNDTEIIIYSASQLKDIGDLSGLKVGLLDCHMARNLRTLKVGDPSQDYSNPNLTDLTIGNLRMLQTIDARNCLNLRRPVDLSGCTNIENAYFDNTRITSLALPNGGILKKLNLPASITSLTIRNQPYLTECTLYGVENLTAINIENIPGNTIDVPYIIKSMPDGSVVRWVNFDFCLEHESELYSLRTALDRMYSATVKGIIHLPSVSLLELDEISERYPEITVVYEHINPSVTFIGVGCSIDNLPEYIEYSGSFSANIIPQEGKMITNYLIKMGKEQITYDTYTNEEIGKIYIPNVSDNIKIEVSAYEPCQYLVYTGLDISGKRENQEGFDGTVVSYMIGDGSVAHGNGLSGGVCETINIPSTHNGLPVIQIGSLVFGYIYTIKHVRIPDSVKTLLDSAFIDCNLIDCTIPDSVTGKLVTTFKNIGIESVVLGSGIEKLSTYVFFGTSKLKRVEFKGKVPPYIDYDVCLDNRRTDCVFAVPYSEDHSILNTYKSTLRMPDPNVYTYIEVESE